MLLDFPSIIKQHNVECTGVIAVGAHFGEEHEAFKSMGITKFIYLEPCQKAFDVLVDKFKENSSVTLFQFAASDHTGKQEMYIETANTGQSNSLLKPKDHLIQHPNITFNSREEVFVLPLDSIVAIAEGCNFLYMDTQGAEMLVLKGATQILKDVDVVYTEVSRTELYEGCARVNEIDEFLWNLGFESVAEYWVSNGTWGDKCYIRKHNA